MSNQTERCCYKVPRKTKNQIRKKATAALVVTAVIITVLVVSYFSSPQVMGQSTDGWLTELPGSYAETVLSGEIVANPEGFQCVSFCVPKGVSYAFLQGDFNSTGNAANRAVNIMVWRAEDFSNWLCGRQSNLPEYNRDFMPAVSGNINLTVPSGLHYVFIGSASYNQTQTVSIKLDLSYGK